LVARSDARGAGLHWRRFPDGAVLFDSRHGRTHLLSPVTADVLELIRVSGVRPSIDDLVDRLLSDPRVERLPDALLRGAAREGVKGIVVELTRLGLIDSHDMEVVVPAKQDSATRIRS
jgi:hypothetical protein